MLDWNSEKRGKKLLNNDVRQAGQQRKVNSVMDQDSRLLKTNTVVQKEPVREKSDFFLSWYCVAQVRVRETGVRVPCPLSLTFPELCCGRPWLLVAGRRHARGRGETNVRR